MAPIPHFCLLTDPPNRCGVQTRQADVFIEANTGLAEEISHCSPPYFMPTFFPHKHGAWPWTSIVILVVVRLVVLAVALTSIPRFIIRGFITARRPRLILLDFECSRVCYCQIISSYLLTLSLIIHLCCRFLGGKLHRP